MVNFNISKIARKFHWLWIHVHEVHFQVNKWQLILIKTVIKLASEFFYSDVKCSEHRVQDVVIK